jgi:hypothetical protein
LVAAAIIPDLAGIVASNGVVVGEVPIVFAAAEGEAFVIVAIEAPAIAAA